MTDVITRGLRDSVRVDRDDLTGEVRCWLPADEFRRLCDEVDAVDASLGAELAEWAERGVLLPLDADGVPVRLDDLMEWPTTGETFEVVGIGDGTLFYIEDGNELADWTGASTKRHHVPDTWASIIEDAIGGRIEDDDEFDATLDALVARCCALAGDAE